VYRIAYFLPVLTRLLLDAARKKLKNLAKEASTKEQVKQIQEKIAQKVKERFDIAKSVKVCRTWLMIVQVKTMLFFRLSHSA
jgi:hypothetical protein